MSQPLPRPEPLASELAPRRDHRWRTRLFQLYLVVAVLGFGGLLALATVHPYLAIDLTITHAVQRYDAPWFLTLMRWVSWPGFGPQTYLITALLILALLAARLRWEAACALLGAGSSGVGLVIKLLVHRPRPAATLVEVVKVLDSYSFPSGHVLYYTAFYGCLLYLAYSLFRPSLGRSLLLVGLGTLIALVGVSRIALGQHWFTDVLAAYLLGSVWLALVVQMYRWGATRFFSNQDYHALTAE